MGVTGGGLSTITSISWDTRSLLLLPAAPLAPLAVALSAVLAPSASPSCKGGGRVHGLVVCSS